MIAVGGERGAICVRAGIFADHSDVSCRRCTSDIVASDARVLTGRARRCQVFYQSLVLTLITVVIPLLANACMSGTPSTDLPVTFYLAIGYGR